MTRAATRQTPISKLMDQIFEMETDLPAGVSDAEVARRLDRQQSFSKRVAELFATTMRDVNEKLRATAFMESDPDMAALILRSALRDTQAICARRSTRSVISHLSTQGLIGRKNWLDR